MSEKNKIDFSLFGNAGKTKQLNIKTNEQKEIHSPKVEEAVQQKTPTGEKKNVEDFVPAPPVKDVADRLNEDVQETIQMEINRMCGVLGNEVKESPFSRPMRVVVVGGSKDFFDHVSEDLAVYPDIEVIKYIPSGNTSILYAIEAAKADILLAHYKMNLQSPADLWAMINEETDDKGNSYKEAFQDIRIVTVVPNFQMENQLRSLGLNFFVEEINHQTFDVDVRTLANRLRYAFFDIANEKRKRLGMKKLNISEIRFPDPIEKAPIQEEVSPVINEQTATPTPVVTRQQVVPTLLQSINDEVDVLPNKPKIIGVYSATGGAGTTMFATNIASILSKYSNMDNPNSYRVALVEYNLACQSIDMAFDLKTDKNLAGLANELLSYYDKDDLANPYKISHDTLRPIISRYMVKEPNTGLDILLGIPVPLEIGKIQPGLTNLLFDTLREMYDVVIVDLSTDIAKTPMLEALMIADEIYYIMPMDTVSIRNTRILAKFFISSFDFKPDDVKIILNKIIENNENFGVKQVYAVMENDQDGLSAPVGNIPFAGEDVRLSLDNGVPIALSNSEHPVTQAIRSIAVMINPMLNDNDIIVADNKKSIAKSRSKDKKGGLLGGIFGGKKEKKEEDKPLRSRKSPKATPVIEEEVEEQIQVAPIRSRRPESVEVEIEEDVPVAVPNFDDEVMEEEPPKKKGFLARLFGGGDKKKKDKKEKKLKKKENVDDGGSRPSKFRRRKQN